MAAIEKPLKTLAVKENKIISIISTRGSNKKHIKNNSNNNNEREEGRGRSQEEARKKQQELAVKQTSKQTKAPRQQDNASALGSS